MSRINNEYGKTYRDITDSYKKEVAELEQKLTALIKDLDLNGEEIRQLFRSVQSEVDVMCSEQIMKWASKYSIDTKNSKAPKIPKLPQRY